MTRPTIPVFDIGKVLIEWDPRHLYRKVFADHDEMERFLATVCTSAWNEAQDAGRSFGEAVASLVPHHPHYEKEIRAFDERWEEMVPGEIAGTVAILETLRRNGHRTYAITNFSTEKFAVTQARFPFLNGFDVIIVSGAEKLLKPEPAIYELLLARYGLAAADCVFIDDNPQNVEGARRVGLHAILFREPQSLRDELAALGFALA